MREAICGITLSSLRLAWFTCSLNAWTHSDWGREICLLCALEAGASCCHERLAIIGRLQIEMNCRYTYHQLRAKFSIARLIWPKLVDVAALFMWLASGYFR